VQPASVRCTGKRDYSKAGLKRHRSCAIIGTTGWNWGEADETDNLALVRQSGGNRDMRRSL